MSRAASVQVELTCEGTEAMNLGIEKETDQHSQLSAHRIWGKNIVATKPIFKQVPVNCRHFTRDANYRPSGGPGKDVFLLFGVIPFLIPSTRFQGREPFPEKNKNTNSTPLGNWRGLRLRICFTRKPSGLGRFSASGDPQVTTEPSSRMAAKARRVAWRLEGFRRRGVCKSILTTVTRSSTREVRIRVPTFFCLF